MKKGLTSAITGWTWLCGGLIPLDAHSQRTPLTIQVHVYNYSGVTGEALTQAEQETATIYRRLGVEIEWRSCPIIAEESAQKRACDPPAAPTRIALRLLSNEMARRFKMDSQVYGFALVS